MLLCEYRRKIDERITERANEGKSKGNNLRRQQIKLNKWLNQGGRCFYCNEMMIITCDNVDHEDSKIRNSVATFDHIKPKSKGGTNRDDNLILACYNCNHEKDNVPVDIFLMYKKGIMHEKLPVTLQKKLKGKIRSEPKKKAA